MLIDYGAAMDKFYGTFVLNVFVELKFELMQKETLEMYWKNVPV